MGYGLNIIKKNKMALKELTMFTMICDNCGCDSNEGGEYSAWNNEENAKYSAQESGWSLNEGKHYCPDCFSYDDEDNLVLSESRKNHSSKSEEKVLLLIDKDGILYSAGSAEFFRPEEIAECIITGGLGKIVTLSDYKANYKLYEKVK